MTGLDPGRRLAVLLNRQRESPPPYITVEIGTVDTVQGVAEVIIEDSDESLPGVPYTGQWLPEQGEMALLTQNGSTPLLVASAEEAFNPTWGGRLEAGAGRELQYNGTFDTDLEGWEAGEGASFFLFDTTNESWVVVAGGATASGPTWIDGANNPQLAQNRGAVVLSALTVGDLTVQSPTVVTVAGRAHRGSAYTKYDNKEGPVVAVIRWFSDTAGTVLIGETIGPEVVVSAGRWDSVQVDAVAPIGAVRARMAVRFFGVGVATVARIDTSFITSPSNATIARELPPDTFSDAFDRADGPVAVGAPITYLTPVGTGVWTVEEGYVRCSGRGAGGNILRVDTGNVNHSVAATLRAPHAIGQGVVWRYIDGANHWRAEIMAITGSRNEKVTINVVRAVGGVEASQGTFQVTLVKGGQDLNLAAFSDVGNWQSVYVNGVRGWYTNSTSNAAGTIVGPLVLGVGGTVTFDDLAASTMGAHIYDGTASLRITSIAAGMASARTPRAQTIGEAAWEAAGEGFAVKPGEWYLIRFRARNHSSTPGRMISFAAVYYDANGAFVGIQFAPPIVPTTGWLTCQQANPVPSGAAYMRLYTGFIATGAGEQVFIDSLTVQRCSVIVQPIITTAPEGRARFEVVPSNNVQVRLWPTDDPADEPGVILAESASMTITPPRNKSAGKASTLVVPADVLDFRQFGTTGWNTWTPSVIGTGWSIGNGVRKGRWMKIGNIVMFAFYIEFGSTSTYGTGTNALALTVPFNRLQGTFATLSGGAVIFEDLSAGVRLPGTCYLRDAPAFGVQLLNLAAATTFGVVNDLTPFTWAADDKIYGQITYEAEDISIVTNI